MQEPNPAGLESFEEFYVNHRVDVYRALAVTLCDPQLDTTEGTVKSRLARALATLRTTMDRADSMVTR